MKRTSTTIILLTLAVATHLLAAERSTIDYKGMSVREPAPYGEAGLAWQNNFKALADRIGPCKFDATTAPTAGDDTTAGYATGSLWYDTAANRLYWCASATAGAAVWIEVSPADLSSVYQPLNANLTTWAGVASSADGRAIVSAADYAAMRGLLGLGTMATQGAGSVAITGGSITGITDLAVADGGTGASDAAGARANLGLVISTDVQAHSENLDTWSSVTPSADGQSLVAAVDYQAMRGLLGVRPGADVQPHSANLDTWAGVLPSANGQSLVSAADYAAMRGLLGLEPGTDVQAYSSRLGVIAALTPTDGNLIVGNGTTWVTQSGATARTTLGLGTLATQGAGAVAITGGSITGIADLAVADGGTGASDAAGARGNLGLGSIATQAANSVAITGGAIDGAAIGATTPGAGRFTTLTSGELAIPSDTKGLALDAAGTTKLYSNGSYLVTNRGMINPGTLVETAGKNRSQVYGHDGTYPYLVYQPYVWNGSSWTATNGFGCGLRALQNNTGTDCAAVGYYALAGNTGNACAGLGWGALSGNQGAESSGIGYVVLQNNTGAQSTGFGSRALRYNTGANAVAIGHRSGENNIGGENSLVGLQSGMYNTGKQVAGLGFVSLIYNTGDNTIAMGYCTGRYNQGNYNTLIGSHIGINFDANDAAAKTFDAAAVDPDTDRITIPSHGFGATGSYKNLKYTEGTAAITGLTSGQIYQAKIIDANTIGFRELDGPNGTTRTIANITAAGTGTGHTFTPQFEYSNVTCLGAKSAPTASNQVTLGDTAVTEVKTSGVILPGGYKSADGSAGITQTIAIVDRSDKTHTMTFKDGLLTNYSTAP